VVVGDHAPGAARYVWMPVGRRRASWAGPAARSPPNRCSRLRSGCEFEGFGAARRRGRPAWFGLSRYLMRSSARHNLSPRSKSARYGIVSFLGRERDAPGHLERLLLSSCS
jgi:hypothetical protein